MIVRRNVLVVIATSLIRAPAVIRTSSLMRVRVLPYEPTVWAISRACTSIGIFRRS